MLTDRPSLRKYCAMRVGYALTSSPTTTSSTRFSSRSARSQLAGSESSTWPLQAMERTGCTLSAPLQWTAAMRTDASVRDHYECMFKWTAVHRQQHPSQQQQQHRASMTPHSLHHVASGGALAPPPAYLPPAVGFTR